MNSLPGSIAPSLHCSNSNLDILEVPATSTQKYEDVYNTRTEPVSEVLSETEPFMQNKRKTTDNEKVVRRDLTLMYCGGGSDVAKTLTSDKLYNAHNGSKKPFNMKNLSQSFTGTQDVMGNDVALKDALKEAVKKSECYYARLSIKEVFREFNTDENSGLTTEEAEKILKHVGFNELETEPPDPLWRIFIAQFYDLLVILLIIACIVAFALGQFAAATCIVVIVIANAILGTLMEHKAGIAMRDLLNMTPSKVQVIRDSVITQIESKNLVPGDIVLLQQGEIVAADIRLIKSVQLTSSEAVLTGESTPCEKNHLAQPNEAKTRGTNRESNRESKIEDGKQKLLLSNMVYQGCEIFSGSGSGIVISTGMATHMGMVAKLLNSTEDEASPLEAKLQRLGMYLGFASIGISVIVFILGVALKRGQDPNKPDQPIALQMLLVSVSLTVAAVPEGLPACVTISLAVGMRMMARKNVIVKKMKSVETLGSATVVCTDKTGTITTGVMTVRRIWIPSNGDTLQVTGEKYSPKGKFLPMDVEITAANEESEDDQYYGNRTALDTLLTNAVLCCDSKTRLQFCSEKNEWDCTGNMSERALVVAAAKNSIKRDILEHVYKIIKVNPFNSKRKMMSTIVRVEESAAKKSLFGKKKFVICVKGAPDILLARCKKMLIIHGRHHEERILVAHDRKRIEQKIDKFSSLAYRVLAVAYRPMNNLKTNKNQDLDIEKDLVLTGLFASIDPEREGVTESIKCAANAGVRTVMITGDYIATAKAIAHNINLLPEELLSEKVRDCKAIRDAGLEEQRLLEINKENEKKNVIPSFKLKQNKDSHYLNADDKDSLRKVHTLIDKITMETDVFARAQPIDKITIVRSLLRQGHIVSMTGDGVNDAPALKQSSIGVAMGITGTDVAKGAADIILADDDFCSIIAAIKEGRTIYANIGKFCYYLLSTNIAEVFVVLIAVLIGYPSPLVPTQILWLNLTTDGFPAISLAVEKPEPGLMEEGPKPANEPLIEKVMITGIVVQTVVLTVLVLATYMTAWFWHTGTLSPEPAIKINDVEAFKFASTKATTMTILMIVFAELARAYTCRSLRQSIFPMGPFSNKYMQYSVFTAVGSTLIVALTPGVQDMFGCIGLDGKEWAFLLGLSLLPAGIDEFTKWIYRITGFGRRPNVIH